MKDIDNGELVTAFAQSLQEVVSASVAIQRAEVWHDADELKAARAEKVGEFFVLFRAVVIEAAIFSARSRDEPPLSSLTPEDP